MQYHSTHRSCDQRWFEPSRQREASQRRSAASACNRGRRRPVIRLRRIGLGLIATGREQQAAAAGAG